MLENKTQLITYVGKKSVKHDTVAGTGIIWCGYGDTHEVMHVAAVKLLRHPDVWMTKAKFDLLSDESETDDLSNEEESAIADAEAKKLADAEKAKIDAEAKRLADEQNSGSEEETDQSESDVDDLPTGGVGLSSAEAQPKEDRKTEPVKESESSPRHNAVKSALLSMDQGNEEHFSAATGNPIIAVVREIAGDATISLRELNAAWSELKSAKK